MQEQSLATAKQKIQYLEGMIGYIDIDVKDHKTLVEAINIYKEGNEPLYTADEMKWLNKCVEKYTEALNKYNSVVIGVADGEAPFPKGETIILGIENAQ